MLGVSAVAGLGGGELGTLLRPIATPLVMSGFEPDVGRHCSAARSATRASSRPAAARPACAPGEMPFDGPLKPGDAIGVTLVNGDLQLGGTGTVTHVDGDRVYAFGHPMYNLGPTEFPMTRAYVYTVLPEPVLLDEAVDAPARSSARSCRIARRRSPAGSAPGRG